MKRLLVAISILLLAACQRAARVPEAVAPAHASIYEMQIGKQAFQKYCAGCHGETGQGDGFNSFNLDPRPRDLSDPAFQKSKSNADLADTIRRGGAGVGLSSLMPPWGHTLDARHVDAVVLYVRSLKRSNTVTGR
jgi:mono/diheme cytochrome c family protein